MVSQYEDLRCLTHEDQPGCGHPLAKHGEQSDCPCCSGVPSEKWAVMNRRERRAWGRGKA